MTVLQTLRATRAQMFRRIRARTAVVASALFALFFLLLIAASFVFAINMEWRKDGGIAGLRAIGFKVGHGGMEFGYFESGMALPLPWKNYAMEFPKHPQYPRFEGNASSGFRGLGFTFFRDSHPYAPTWWIVIFPLWLPLALFAIAPTLSLRSACRRRLRLREGYCEHCGYDLRATPDRCPECGTVRGPA